MIEDEEDQSARKRRVDLAFASLLSQLNAEKNSLQRKPQIKGRVQKRARVSEDDLLENEQESDESEIEVERYSDDNSENLDDFSGLEDLDLSAMEEDGDEILPAATKNAETKKRGPNTNRTFLRKEYAAEGRKQRGLHKLAGMFVCLLSSGETGYVVKKMGGRISLKVRSLSMEFVPASLEKLHVFRRQPKSSEDEVIYAEEFIQEIVDHCQYVPQLEDIAVGTRVAMLRYGNATGRVCKLPNKKDMYSMAHVVVRMDVGEVTERKSVLEMLRIIHDDHGVVAFEEDTKVQPGRPTKGVLANRAPVSEIVPLVPPSKLIASWKRSLQPPCFADMAKCAPYEEEEPKEKKILKKPPPANPNKVKLMRAQMLCYSCEAIISTGCKKCVHCGALKRKKNTDFEV